MGHLYIRLPKPGIVHSGGGGKTYQRITLEVNDSLNKEKALELLKEK